MQAPVVYWYTEPRDARDMKATNTCQFAYDKSCIRRIHQRDWQRRSKLHGGHIRADVP